MEELNQETLDLLEKRIEDLRVMHEHYFLGSRKNAPDNERTSVLYLIRRLSNQHSPNHSVRFRLAQLVSKFNSYLSYWNRIMMQMEAGTYKRDVFKAKLRAQAQQAEEQAAKTGPRPAPQPGTGMPGDRVDSLYQEFLKARQSLNQSVEGISKEKIAATLNKQLPALQEKYKGKKVDFKVVVENGQAKLKAVAK